MLLSKQIILLLSLGSFLYAGCSSLQGSALGTVSFNENKLSGNDAITRNTFELAPYLENRHQNDIHQLLSVAAVAQQKGDSIRMRKAVDSSLKLDPGNPGLHALNGLLYLQEHDNTGNRPSLDLAIAAFQSALKIDPANAQSRYFLGITYMQAREYTAAQMSFAEGAILRPDDEDVLYKLAVCSYLAGDPVGAAAALKGLSKNQNFTQRERKLSALVSASLGEFTDAQKLAESVDDIGEVSRRINDWNRLYTSLDYRNDGSPNAGHLDIDSHSFLVSNQSNYDEPPRRDDYEPWRDNDAPLRRDDYTNKDDEEEYSDYDEDVAADYDDEYGEEYASDEETNGTNQKASNRKPMVVLDVVLIATEDDVASTRGVNLLSGLQVRYGGDINKEKTRSEDRLFDVVDQYSNLRTVTEAISIPQLTYSLNIANAFSSRNEILARPTLVASEGRESKFFSGRSIIAAAVANGNGGGSVDVESEVGVTLNITPSEIDSDRVRLFVEAERTFLRPPSNDIDFEFRIDTSKVNVSAEVDLFFGETLVLGGLSERETERSRDGVPGLQDIPILQYVFSERGTRDFQRSAIILVTPRLPNYVYRPKEALEKDTGSSQLSEFQARYSDWFKPYPNWASIFNHLQRNDLYREFRTGDVSLERWNEADSFDVRVGEIIDLIYY